MGLDAIVNISIGELEKMKEELNELKNNDSLKAVKFLEKKGLKPQEIMDYLKVMDKYKSPEQNTYSIAKNNVKILYMSDTHIGNINYKPELMKFAYKMAKKENVDMILHSGDICEGWYQNRPTQIFELNAIGADQQIALAVKELKPFKTLDKPFYFITGNHEENTFMRGAGIEIGKCIQHDLKEEGLESYFLGNAEGDIKLKSGVIIKMLHPDGGSAYSISYRSQKIAESMSGGEKPNILLIGHYHKAEYIFYRNIHILQGGCFRAKTNIVTKEGPKHIKFIKEGDLVLTHKNRFRKVIKTFKRKTEDDFYKLTFSMPNKDRSNVVATREHPILVERKGKKVWLPIKDIIVNDTVFILANTKLPNNNYTELDKETGFIKVKVLLSEKLVKKYKTNTVYNFEVAEDNSYIASNVVVHNCLEGQTKFMKGKHLSAHTGFWIIDINSSKGQVNYITPTFYPSYD
jgi:predicted phosphodiesterase